MECASGINPDIQRFDTSIFDGDYVAGKVDAQYLHRVETLRGDTARAPARDSGVMELHNQV